MSSRVPWRFLAGLAIASAVGIGATGCQLSSNSSASESTPSAKAARDDITVSVGGVGRIVYAGAVTRAPEATGSGGTSSGTGTSAPANAVYPSTSGSVLRYLVVPGQHVVFHQPLLLLDDGGVGLAASKQAEHELAASRLELAQLLDSQPADVSAATLEVKRAQAELEALLGGTPAARARAIRAARRNVELAQSGRARILAPPSSADVRAAEAEVKKAEAERAALRKPAPPPSPKAMAAAKQAVIAARQKRAKVMGPPDPVAVSVAQQEAAQAEANLALLLAREERARPELAAARAAIDAANTKLTQINGPPEPAPIYAADADLKKAEADLEALKKTDPAPSQKAVTAAEQAVTAARFKLAKVSGPPDPVAVTVVQQEVAQAESNLALVLARGKPTQPELAAAVAAVGAAHAKRKQINRPPDAATVSGAEADVKKAEADLEALTKKPLPPSAEAVAASEKSVEAAKLKLAKLKGPPRPADMRAARLELERTRAELRALRIGASPAAISAAKQAVTSSQAKLARLAGSPTGIAELKVKAAEEKLDTARFAQRLLTVRSPSDGTVTALLSFPAAPVERSTPIATVTNLDSLSVNVDLSEFDVAQVKLGQKAVVSVDALGGKIFPGSVAFVALTGTESAGVVTFPVRVTLTSSEGLKPGMNVSVRIIVAQKSDVVQVPLEAVTQDEEDNAFVTVADESGQETQRPVKLGLANNESVEIVKGLRAGESVVLAESAATATEEP